MYSFAHFEDSAPSWEALQRLVAERKSELGLPDADLEAVGLLQLPR